MDSLVERVAMKFQGDLHPPLGDPGGPCQVIQRIDHAIHNPGLRDELVNEVNKGEDLANSDAAKVYPMAHDKGVGPIKGIRMTSHGQYRMDLREVTVQDVRNTLGSLLQQMGMWKQKNHPSYKKYQTDLDKGNKIEWTNPKSGLKIVFALVNGVADIITTYWLGESNPSPPHGKCEIKHAREEAALIVRVAERFY